MSGVWDTLQEGTRRIASVFGFEKTVPLTGRASRKIQAEKTRARRRATDLTAPEDSLGRSRRRAAEISRARSGRVSTVLTSDDDRLGG